MKLPRFLRKLLKQRTHRDERRTERLAKVERMGYQVQDRSGLHNGHFANRRYFLISPSGDLMDNDGVGYASSSEVYKAAMQDQEKHKKAI